MIDVEDPAADVTEVERLRRRLARGLALAGAALALALLVLGLAAGAPGASLAGEPPPAFALGGLDGPGVTNADLAGRVAVINVWASWCPPCREEAPALRRVHAAEDPARVAFLGVVSDDTAARARSFAERYALPYPNALDDGSFARAYGVRGLPMTFVLTADGAVLARHFGPIGESRLRALIADALARGTAGAATGP